MIPDMTMTKFLTILASCSGDEALDLINKFQSGAFYVDGVSADELMDKGE